MIFRCLAGKCLQCFGLLAAILDSLTKFTQFFRKWVESMPGVTILSACQSEVEVDPSTYSEINPQADLVALHYQYPGLGDEEWRECIDGAYHHLGKGVLAQTLFPLSPGSSQARSRKGIAGGAATHLHRI